MIFSDISTDLLERCREPAAEAGLEERCRFVSVPATDLSEIEDASVDAVTLRSVLVYEPDKASAFAEFHRVLRPGGRSSVFEPVNRFSLPEPPERLHGYDVRSVVDIAVKVKAVYDATQPSDFDPKLDFDERDLLRLAEQVGYKEIHSQLQVDIHRMEPASWAATLNSSGNPRVPTLAEAIDHALTPGGLNA